MTIGTFDGVHRGHAALVHRARELAGHTGRVIVMSFDPHPLASINPSLAPPRLTTFPTRRKFLLALGADEVHRIQPTPDTLNLEPEQFIRQIVERFSPSHIVEGCDFRFGRDRSGTVTTLMDLGPKMGFNAECLDAVSIALTDHTLVRASSSLARWLLHHGRVKDLALVLNRPHEFTGEVRPGHQRGRTINIPTANVYSEVMLPSVGVYAGYAYPPSGGKYRAAINIGTSPTFGEHYRHAEVHLIDYEHNGPEYDWTLRVELHRWVRDPVRFPDTEALKEQILRDIERIHTMEFIGSDDRQAVCADTSCLPAITPARNET